MTSNILPDAANAAAIRRPYRDLKSPNSRDRLPGGDCQGSRSQSQLAFGMH